MTIRTYQVGSDWVVADDAGWLDGVFPTEEAAIAHAQQENA